MRGNSCATEQQNKRKNDRISVLFCRASGPDVRMTFVRPATDGKETMFTPVSVFLPIDEKLESGEVSGILCARGLALRDAVIAQEEAPNDDETV
jgi:hypothetical protein